MQAIARAISNNKAFAHTDGSYKVRGSAGFCITDFKGRSLKGACRVLGNTDDQSSCCSELAGIYAMMKLAENLCNKFHICSGSLILACDNEAAGYSIAQMHFPTPRQNDFDLLQAIARTKC